MKHKKIMIISVILLAITFIVMALSNSTYALFSNDSYGANTNVYTTGMLLIEASSKSENISLANVLPMSDEEGLKTNPYVFTIKNIGNLDYLFDVKLLSTGDSSTSFSPQYIKLQIDDGEVITLSSLNNGKIKSGITLNAGDSVDVSIRAWLSIETPNSEIGKSFNSKIVTDGQAIYTSSNNEFKINFLNHITKLYNSAEKTEITNNNIIYNQAQSVGLMSDRLGGTTEDYDSGNIRYYGANPNNYIYFNCSDYYNQNDSTCEKWRIIGIVDGKVKLIRDQSIGDLAWDQNKNIDSSLTTFTNNWETASLQLMLNNSYYNGDTAGTITYYSGETATVSTSLNMNTLGIKNGITRDMISESTWYLGGYSTSQIYPNEIYNYERTNEVNVTIKEDNPFTITASVGIMYASDYGYATDFAKCNQLLNSYNSSANSYACRKGNWLYNGDSQWLLAHRTKSNRAYAWSITTTGVVSYQRKITGDYEVRPVIYLDTEIMLSRGDGSLSKPYQIYVETTKLTEHIIDLYANNNPTLITHSKDDGTSDTYYYSYQDSTSTWGIMNDGLKVSDTYGAGATTITDTNSLITGIEGNIRYFGPSDSVNNYIYFNCSDYSKQSASTCEKWRIIGIVDGKVKLIRSESIGDLAWDLDFNQNSSSYEALNNWKTSSLQLMLNSSYYNGDTAGTIIYYSGDYPDNGISTGLNMNKLGIKNDITRNMISESTWYLGGYDDEDIYSDMIYHYERTNIVGTTIYSDNPYTINAKIGLMYPSDYGYATDLSKCSDSLSDYGDTYVCSENNWLSVKYAGLSDIGYWLITPCSSSYDNEAWGAWEVNMADNIRSYETIIFDPAGVLPVLYLTSDIRIESGRDGSSDNPYRIVVQ